MGQTSEIKKGIAIRHQGEIFIVHDFQHVSPGKGSSFVRTKLKNLSTGKAIEVTYKASESVDIVDVQFQTMQYLFQVNDTYTFMRMDNFDQVEIKDYLMGDDIKYLKDNLEVIVGLYEGLPVSVSFPKKITYKVISAPPAVKGDSSSGNITKTIELENGLKVQAPIFIKEGESVIVNTVDGEYSARA